jgi:hypothetical protein
MKNTQTTPVVGASDDVARPDAPPGPVTQRLQRSRGRPSKAAPTDGQMTFAGEVVTYVEPPSRSRWAEPNPEYDDFQNDDPEAVAVAAAEAITTDVDGWLREQVPDPKRHFFSKWWTSGVQTGLLAEGASLSQQRALDLHLNAIGSGYPKQGQPPNSHFQPLWQVNKSTSCEHVTSASANGKTSTTQVWTGGVLSRSAMMKGTRWLVEHGWLVKQDRGWLDARNKRPPLYTIAPKVFELSRKPGDDTDDEVNAALQVLQDALSPDVAAKLAELVRVSQEHPSNESPQDQTARVSQEHPGARVSQEYPTKSKDLNQLASSGEEEKPSNGYTAPGAQCVTCGGPVTTNPNTGRPNERCKACYSSAKTERATAEVTALDHLAVMRSLMGQGWGNRYASRGSGLDQAELLRRFGGDEAAVKAAQSLQFRFGELNDRDAGPAWRAAYATAGGRS